MRAYKFITISILVLLTGLMDVCAVAGDWPNFRGPQHNGISNEDDWGGDWPNCTPSEPLWSRQVGTGYSSIAVADGRVYTMGNTGNTDTVFCLDATTGGTLWTHPYPAALDPDSYEGGPSATPTVADGNVYTLSKRGMAYCLDANDGEVVWGKNLTASPYNMTKPTWGFAGSPYVDGNLVIYNAGTHGMALYTSDGTLAWLTGTARPGYSTPVPFYFEGQDYVVLMGRTTFAAVEVQTGDMLWEQHWETYEGSPGKSKVNAADAIVDSNRVFVSSGYNKGSALFDVSTGHVTQLWPPLPQKAMQDMRTKMNSCVLWQGYLYGPNEKGGALTCVRLSDGIIKWTKGGFGLGSVTLADGKLIFLSEYGDLYIAEASPDSYQEIGRGKILSSRCWSVPVLANGKIYARNSTGKLVCVELETTAPKVDAGSSIITWLKDGTTTVDLSGAVVDDNNDVTIIRWSVILPPRATVDFADNSAPVTTATLTKKIPYVLELYARDATGQEGDDQIEVRVYADSCEAAKNNPNGGYAAPLYDYNNDCIENFNDFAMFAAEWIENFNDFAVFADEWLEDESLTDDVLYDAD